jgi:hypothetical protein
MVEARIRGPQKLGDEQGIPILALCIKPNHVAVMPHSQPVQIGQEMGPAEAQRINHDAS